MLEVEDPKAAAPLRDAATGWGSDTFVLKYPFRFANVDYHALTLRIPSGADMQAFLDGTDTSNRALVLRLAEADKLLIDAMHGSDFARLMIDVGKYVTGAR